MKILIIDGHGGKMGRQLVENMLSDFPGHEIMAVGTNSIATSSMLKGGAKYAATGENAVIVASRKADVIIGPVGIAIADSLFGEVTQRMALAVAQAEAIRILIPVNKCNNLIAGIENMSISDLLADVNKKLSQLVESRS